MVDDLEMFESKKEKTPDQERNLKEARKRGYDYMKKFMNNELAEDNIPLLIIFSYHLRMADND